MLLRSTTVLVLLAVFNGIQALACSCRDAQPLCNSDFDQLETSEVLFVGRVVSISSRDPRRLWRETAKRLFPDAASPETLALALRTARPEVLAQLNRIEAQQKIDLWGEFMTPEDREAVLAGTEDPERPDFGFKWYGRKVEVEVVERFVGDVKDRVTLSTGFGGGDCGIHFVPGEEYLINAGAPKNGFYSVGICSQTAHVYRHQDTLASLRAWQQGEPRPSIVAGVVRDWTPGRSPRLMESVEVLLRSDNTLLETVTDANGAFRFEDVPRAVFRAEIDAPGYDLSRDARNRLTLDMTANRCGSLSIGLHQHQAAIRGRVLPFPGEEIPNRLSIEALPANANTLAPHAPGMTTDEGEFVVDELEPGRFYLGINIGIPPTGPDGQANTRRRISPYPPSYYPGVSDPAQAAVFELQRGQTVDIGDWMLPARLKEVPVPGRVLLPDGSPAADARLILRRPGRDETISQIGPTPADGAFAVHLLATIDYEIEAVARVGETVYRATVAPGSERPSEIVIRLEPSKPREADGRFFNFSWH